MFGQLYLGCRFRTVPEMGTIGKLLGVVLSFFGVLSFIIRMDQLFITERAVVGAAEKIATMGTTARVQLYLKSQLFLCPMMDASFMGKTSCIPTKEQRRGAEHTTATTIV